MSIEGRLQAARWLLQSGLGASAIRLVSGIRSRVANDLREAAATASMREGIYALVVAEGDGLVVPLEPRVGLGGIVASDLDRTYLVAIDVVRKTLGARTLARLRLELEELLVVNGSSLGLATALAFLAHYAPRSAPKRPVLATGSLTADGRIEPVAHMSEKLAAARLEAGDRLILVPPGQAISEREIEVSTLKDAVAIALQEPLIVDASRASLDTVIERARDEANLAARLALLEAIDSRGLGDADRARVLLERGTALRHLGRTVEASRQHEEARSLLVTTRAIIGADAAERYELECILTAMDDFRLDEATSSLVRRLTEPFLSTRNELRARGMLAQALAMAGNYARAVDVRRENLPLHDLSEELGRTRAGTLCYLALDAARAGDEKAFSEFRTQLLEVTPVTDEGQWRYTSSVVIRGLCALGRFDEALAWQPPEAVRSRLAARAGDATHPETSTRRARMRALRGTGRPEDAVALSATTAQSGDAIDLIAWTSALVDLEAALAERDLGRDPSPRLERARAALARLHPAASAYHSPLLTCSLDELEAALDSVYY